MTDLSDHIAAIVQELKPEAEREAERAERAVLSVLMSMVRPHVRRVLNDEAAGDHRERPYTVSATVWDTSQGEKTADMIAEADAETVLGLNAAIEKVAEWIDEIAEGEQPDAVKVDALLARSRNLRSMLTRGGGVTSFRVRWSLGSSPAQSFLVVAEVTRIDNG